MEKNPEVMMNVDPDHIPGFAAEWLQKAVIGLLSAVGALLALLIGTYFWLFRKFDTRMDVAEKAIIDVQKIQTQDALKTQITLEGLVSRKELTEYMSRFRLDLKERDDRKSNQDTERHVENRVQLDRLVDGLNNVRLESREDITALRGEIRSVEEGIATVAASAHKRIDDILKER